MKFNNEVRFIISIHAKTDNTTVTVAEQKSISSSNKNSIFVLSDFGKMYLYTYMGA